MKNNKANKKSINVYKNKSFRNSNIIFNYIFNKLKHKRYTIIPNFWSQFIVPKIPYYLNLMLEKYGKPLFYKNYP